MKKITQILIWFFAFSIILFAQISEDQVNKYMDISRAKTLLSGTQYDIVKRYSYLFSSAYLATERCGSKEAKAIGIERAKCFAKNKDFIKKYRNTFQNMDPSRYDEIIHFYTTKIGKKLSNAGIPIKNTEATKESQNYIKRAQNTIISKEKQKLLNEISKEFNLIELKVKLKRALLVSFAKRKDSGYTQEKIKQTLRDIKNNLIRYNKILMKITYLDFNENELKIVLEYASTEAGKLDMQLMYDALINYNITVQENLSYYINQENKSLCPKLQTPQAKPNNPLKASGSYNKP